MKPLGLILAIALSMLTGIASAQSNPDKPFAEKFVVLQISDADPGKQTTVLNVAGNLLKHYGPDKIDVEIVAFGPGLRLLFKDNANAPRIDGLSESGVRFAACNNTLTRVTQLLGDEPELHANSTNVSAGVVRIMDLVAEGYTLVKP
jgi:intracellular sulfur oxidation DsrE/DsrF family protein